MTTNVKKYKYIRNKDGTGYYVDSEGKRIEIDKKIEGYGSDLYYNLDNNSYLNEEQSIAYLEFVETKQTKEEAINQIKQMKADDFKDLADNFKFIKLSSYTPKKIPYTINYRFAQTEKHIYEAYCEGRNLSSDHLTVDQQAYALAAQTQAIGKEITLSQNKKLLGFVDAYKKIEQHKKSRSFFYPLFHPSESRKINALQKTCKEEINKALNDKFLKDTPFIDEVKNLLKFDYHSMEYKDSFKQAIQYGKAVDSPMFYVKNVDNVKFLNVPDDIRHKCEQLLAEKIFYIDYHKKDKVKFRNYCDSLIKNPEAFDANLLDPYDRQEFEKFAAKQTALKEKETFDKIKESFNESVKDDLAMTYSKKTTKTIAAYKSKLSLDNEELEESNKNGSDIKGSDINVNNQIIDKEQPEINVINQYTPTQSNIDNIINERLSNEESEKLVDSILNDDIANSNVNNNVNNKDQSEMNVMDQDAATVANQENINATKNDNEELEQYIDSILNDDIANSNVNENTNNKDQSEINVKDQDTVNLDNQENIDATKNDNEELEQYIDSILNDDVINENTNNNVNENTNNDLENHIEENNVEKEANDDELEEFLKHQFDDDEYEKHKNDEVNYSNVEEKIEDNTIEENVINNNEIQSEDEIQSEINIINENPTESTKNSKDPKKFYDAPINPSSDETSVKPSIDSSNDLFKNVKLSTHKNTINMNDDDFLDYLDSMEDEEEIPEEIENNSVNNNVNNKANNNFVDINSIDNKGFVDINRIPFEADINDVNEKDEIIINNSNEKAKTVEKELNSIPVPLNQTKSSNNK